MKFKKILFTIGYWLLQITWGSLMTIIGAFAILGALIAGGKVHRNGPTIIVEIGGNWGGLELGAFALCGKYSESSPEWFAHTRKHEFGHSLQNCIFGPLMPFVVVIPSAIRYWYRNLNNITEPEYDAIWFEGTATKYGSKLIDWLEN